MPSDSKPVFSKVKPHMTGRSMLPNFKVLSELYPDIDLAEISRQAGVPIEIVSQPNAYISYGYFRAFYALLPENIQSSGIDYLVGRRGLSTDILDPFVLSQILALKTPENAFLAIPEFVGLFNRLLTAKVRQLDSSRFETQFAFNAEGLDSDERIDLAFCFPKMVENTRGYLDSIPTVFGQKAAQSVISDVDFASMRCTTISTIPNKALWFQIKQSMFFIPFVSIASLGSLFLITDSWSIGLMGPLYVLASSNLKLRRQVQHSNEVKAGPVSAIRTSSDENARTLRFALDQTTEMIPRSQFKQMAHDIKSPLIALSVLKDQHTESVPANVKAMIGHVANRIESIVEPLNKMSFARYLDPNLSSQIDLLQVIELVALTFEETRLLHPNRIFSLVVAPELYNPTLFLIIDQSLFTQGISNLLRNAAEASSSTVNLTIKSRHNYLELCFENDGQTFPMKVMDAFYSGADLDGLTIDKPGGQGIGLSSSIRTIRTFGGTVEISNHEDKKAKLVAKLPLNAIPVLLTIKNG